MANSPHMGSVQFPECDVVNQDVGSELPRFPSFCITGLRVVSEVQPEQREARNAEPWGGHSVQ